MIETFLTVFVAAFALLALYGHVILIQAMLAPGAGHADEHVPTHYRI